MILRTLGLALALSLVASSAFAANLGFHWQEGAGGRLGVVVLDRDRGTPVTGAQVVVAERLDATSDRQTGTFQSEVLEFDLPTTVTQAGVLVRAPGYVSFGLLGVSRGVLKVFLTPNQASSEVVVTGRLSGWAPRSGSDRIMAGLVFRALSVFDLVQFQFNQIISPLRDTIDVMGARQIPANVVLPEQRVSIPLSSLRLNKPDYRLPLNAGQAVPLAAVQGEMRSGDLINLFLGGGKFDFGVLNLLKLTKVGITDVVNPQAGSREDFSAAYAVTPRHTVVARSAPFPADIIVAAAVDTQDNRNRLVPTDLKTAAKANEAPRAVRLSGAGPELAGTRIVAGLAVGEEGKRLTGIAVVGAGDTVQLSEFRPVDRLEDFQTAPEQMSVVGVSGGLASLVLQKRLPPDSEGKPKVGEVLAQIYALPTVAAGTSVSLTGLGLTAAEVGRYAVHAFELGPEFDPARIDADHALDGLRRFSRTVATYRR